MFKNSCNLTENARKVRMSVGIILLVVGLFALTELFRTAVIILATYSMITGIVGYCPASEILGGSGNVRRSVAHHHKRRK